jgi:hypothetical protein
MKRIIEKVFNNKSFTNYCENMLKMYNFGRVNCLA